MCVLLLLGEPFNGQLETEERGQEDREEREKNQEKEDSRVEAPEVFTSESTQTFPVRHPERFPSHRPDNLVPPAPQPPRRSRDYNWKQLGTTECSTTCGKGKPVQKSQARQIREDPVDEAAPHEHEPPVRWFAHVTVWVRGSQDNPQAHPIVGLTIQKICAPTPRVAQ